ncbi:MAG: hypothetical protein IVW57_16415 [Ktedonobacterales bacterium]|nr:hypothetical protein [Ktedonobacterales bacterium]
MLEDAITLILGMVLMVVGVLTMASTIRDAWGQGRRRRDGSAPPAARPTSSWVTVMRLAIEVTLVLVGVSVVLLLVPAVKAQMPRETRRLIFSAFVMLSGLLAMAGTIRDARVRRRQRRQGEEAAPPAAAPPASRPTVGSGGTGERLAQGAITVLLGVIFLPLPAFKGWTVLLALPLLLLVNIMWVLENLYG